jgi:hypothetical protein
MAMKSRSRLESPTLRILIDPTRVDAAEVVFQSARGDAEPVELARCRVEDLGAPPTLTGPDRIADQGLHVPRKVMKALREATDALETSPLAPHDALWLEFPSPRGFLYILPWERLLRSLRRTLLRLPNHLVRPQVLGHSFEVALCVSTSMVKEALGVSDIVESLVDQYLHFPERDVTVHIFTDIADYLEVHNQFDGYSGRIVVHDPNVLRSEESSFAHSISSPANPWLQWMGEAMNGIALDFVHFVSRGCLTGDRGAIAVAGSPTGQRGEKSSNVIGATSLSTFLSRVGAWGFALTGAGGSDSGMGMRELADAITFIRPGVAVTHDIESDPSFDQMRTVLSMIFGSGADLHAALPAIACWVHPQFVDTPIYYSPSTDEIYLSPDQDLIRDEHQFRSEYSSGLHLNIDGSSTFIAGPTRRALADSTTENWVASASRVLETKQMQWLSDSPDGVTDPAAETALRNVADLVEQHVNDSDPRWGSAR